MLRKTLFNLKTILDRQVQFNRTWVNELTIFYLMITTLRNKFKDSQQGSFKAFELIVHVIFYHEVSESSILALFIEHHSAIT